MISVTIVRGIADRRIMAFTIEGHANYAKHGKDIVCAGVSSVSVGTVNAIEKLAGAELPATMKDGWLSSEIPALSDSEANERMQLLLESMVVMLDTIEKSYGKHVVIHEQFR